MAKEIMIAPAAAVHGMHTAQPAPTGLDWNGAAFIPPPA